MIAPVPSLQALSASISERRRPDTEAATGLNALCADVPDYDDLGPKSPSGKLGDDLPERRILRASGRLSVYKTPTNSPSGALRLVTG